MIRSYTAKKQLFQESTLTSAMLTQFLRIFTPASGAKPLPLSHQSIPLDERSLYIVGDLHGSLGLLQQIETAIIADMSGAPAHFILLGDMIDRGPDSADVLDHLLRRPPVGLTRHAILGNHEAMFLRFLQNPSQAADWLDFGGRETLASYSIDPHKFAGLSPKQQRHQIDANIPSAHRQFLAQLPAVLTWGDVVFAHSGFNFAAQPAAQSEATVLWARAPTAADTVPTGHILVHGHFPIEKPDITQRVINLDVGAYLKNRACVLHINPLKTLRMIEI